LIAVHYFGFPCEIQPLAEVAWEQGLLLIEDCAHVLFSNPPTWAPALQGSVRVFSFPKYFPVPDGALLEIQQSLGWSLPKPQCLAWRILAINGCDLLLSWLAARAGLPLRGRLRQVRLVREVVNALLSDRGQAFDPDHDPSSEPSEFPHRVGGVVTGHRPSAFSLRLVAASDVDTIARRRRRNYAVLMAQLTCMDEITPIFRELPLGVCPMGFPILVKNRDALGQYLLDHHIDPRPVWSGLPRDVDSHLCPTAAWLARHNLVLPIHQDLGDDHMDYLLQHLKKGSTLG